MSDVRPTGGFPAWASGVSGAAAIAEPTTTKKALGWQTAEKPAASYMNWFQLLTYQWLDYLDSGIGGAAGLLGDGSDGDLCIGSTGVATGATTSFQMSRHMYFRNLRVSGVSGVLDTNGFIPFVLGKFDGVSGTIKCLGTTGMSGGQDGGAGAFMGWGGRGASGPLRGGPGGGTGFGGDPTIVYNCLGGQGASGGQSQASSGGGLAGTGISPSGAWRKAPSLTDGIVHWYQPSGGMTGAFLRGGVGGGPGGNDAVNGGGGGGGGAGGGLVLIPCNEVDFVGVFDVRGGPGGRGANGGSGGGGGGGAGGSGGAAIVSYFRKTTLTVRVDSRGGAGGAAGTAAVAGATGLTGATGVMEFRLSKTSY